MKGVQEVVVRSTAGGDDKHLIIVNHKLALAWVLAIYPTRIKSCSAVLLISNTPMKEFTAKSRNEVLCAPRTLAEQVFIIVRYSQELTV